MSPTPTSPLSSFRPRRPRRAGALLWGKRLPFRRGRACAWPPADPLYANHLRYGDDRKLCATGITHDCSRYRAVLYGQQSYPGHRAPRDAGPSVLQRPPSGWGDAVHRAKHLECHAGYSGGDLLRRGKIGSTAWRVAVRSPIQRRWTGQPQGSEFKGQHYAQGPRS